MVAGVNVVADLFGLARQLFAALRRTGEFARNVDKFLYPPADLAQICFHTRAAIAQNLSGSSLVPIQTSSLDHLIQEPSLFTPAAHFAFGLNAHKPPIAGPINFA